MEELRQLIRCGCTAKIGGCVHRSWASESCACPCHFTPDKTKSLISAYLHLGNKQIKDHLKALNEERAEPKIVVKVKTIEYACGHPKEVEGKLSRMAEQYIRQNNCDLCLTVDKE